jgi:hypothetical protein
MPPTATRTLTCGQPPVSSQLRAPAVHLRLPPSSPSSPGHRAVHGHQRKGSSTSSRTACSTSRCSLALARRVILSPSVPHAAPPTEQQLPQGELQQPRPWVGSCFISLAPAGVAKEQAAAGRWGRLGWWVNGGPTLLVAVNGGAAQPPRTSYRPPCTAPTATPPCSLLRAQNHPDDRRPPKRRGARRKQRPSRHDTREQVRARGHAPRLDRGPARSAPPRRSHLTGASPDSAAPPGAVCPRRRDGC